MATSLYDLSVPTFLQTVKAVGGFLDRAATHCAETHADPEGDDGQARALLRHSVCLFGSLLAAAATFVVALRIYGSERLAVSA